MDETPLSARPDWPAWLNEYELDDALLARAYDTTPAPLRSCLKNSMGLHYALWGERPARTAACACDSVHGFRVQRRRVPAAWAVCCFTPTYASPARLLGALMPAVLAGIPLAAVCVDGPPHSAACLVLELLGVSRIYTLTAQQCRDLLVALAADDDGRVLLLHAGELAPLRDAARRACVWEEDSPPAVWITPDCSLDAALLDYAQPDALRLPAGAAPECPSPHLRRQRLCRFRADAALTLLPTEAALTLGPGMEGCWIHPDLTPDFFYSTRVQAAIYEEDI